MASLFEIEKCPSSRTLLWFGVMLVAFLALMGGMVHWRLQAPKSALLLWSAGGTLALVYWAIPITRRSIYLGWIYAAFPVGWTISYLTLSIFYYLILTPVGLSRRLANLNSLEKTLDYEAPTYWTKRSNTRNPKQYFRQF